MKPKVYVETSVVSYLTAWPSGDLIISARQKITRDWWRNAPATFELVASERVIREAGFGDADAAKDRLAVLEGLPLLVATHEAQDLVDALVAKGAMPPSELEDAMHIALAVVNGVEYLATWNFKHIANATMRSLINDTCSGAGYLPTIICTPEELIEAKP
jgi:predicted nucleic acid-binding protein